MSVDLVLPVSAFDIKNGLADDVDTWLNEQVGSIQEYFATNGSKGYRLVAIDQKQIAIRFGLDINLEIITYFILRFC